MAENDVGMTPASDGGSEYQGDLGLPTVDTDVTPDGGPEDQSPADAADSPDVETLQGDADGDLAQAQEARERFELLGKEWDSRDAFEQHYKSLDGRIRSTGQELAKLNNIIDQWERWHEYQETAQKAVPDVATPKVDEQAKEPFLEAVDWAAVKRLNDEKGFDVAAKAMVLGLQDHIQSTVLKGLEDKIEAATAPIRAKEQAEQADYEIKNWFMEAARTVDADGNSLFPELDDQGSAFEQETATHIVNAWADLTRSYPQFGMSKDGIDYAIAMGRQVAQQRAQNSSAATAAARTVTRNAQGQFVKQSEAATAAEEGKAVDTSDVAPKGRTVNPEDDPEAIRKAIKNAGRGDSRASFFGVV